MFLQLYKCHKFILHSASEILKAKIEESESRGQPLLLPQLDPKVFDSAMK
jgi:hypothetical protein